MTTYLLANKSTYQSLQSFQSIEDMNHAVKRHKKLVSSKKHKNIYRVLDIISQYSCVYFGVSWLTINHISDLLGISYKTTQRALYKLTELNIIKKYACKRDGGDRRQSSNIYVILPVNNESDVPQVPDQEAPLLNSKSINNTDDTERVDLSTNNVDKDLLIKKGLVTKLPQPLQFLEHFFSGDDIYKICGTIFKAKKSENKEIKIEDHPYEYYHAVLSVLNSYKRNKVNSLHAVLYTAIKSVTRSIWLKDSFSRLVF